jgi:hypothetical protein
MLLKLLYVSCAQACDSCHSCARRTLYPGTFHQRVFNVWYIYFMCDILVHTCTRSPLVHLQNEMDMYLFSMLHGDDDAGRAYFFDKPGSCEGSAAGTRRQNIVW